jgi:hypothetical protein
MDGLSTIKFSAKEFFVPGMCEGEGNHVPTETRAGTTQLREKLSTHLPPTPPKMGLIGLFAIVLPHEGPPRRACHVGWRH